MKTVAILGSTGSIGKNTLKVVTQLKGQFKVIALAAGGNVSCFARQINQVRPQLAAVMDKEKFKTLKRRVTGRTKLTCGLEGIEQVAGIGADIVVMAIGASGALLPTLKALETTKRLAMANKESLVMAGEIIMRKSKRRGVEIIPIDSEHSAILQCLKAEPTRSVEKIYLTGSGGPLRNLKGKAFDFVRPEAALNHPRWKMGKKISIDSATLMNKGFEIIEAHYLFGLPPEKIEVLIHPECVVHSLVQFVDGSCIGQLGIADMRIPIQYSLTYPNRVSARLPRLNFSKIEKFSFYLPDLAKFPCLKLAMQVARHKGLAQVVLSACDEECVQAYLLGKIKITDIARIIEAVLSKLRNKLNPTLDDILQTEKWTREQTRKIISNNTI